jgi:hypothetical protein
MVPSCVAYVEARLEGTAASIIGPNFRETHSAIGSRMCSAWESLINCRDMNGAKFRIVGFADLCVCIAVECMRLYAET